MKKRLLIIVMSINAILQLIWGLWIFLDYRTIAAVFLGKTIDHGLIVNPEFVSLYRVTGTCFLMLSSYSFLASVLMYKDRLCGAIVALVSGAMITIISAATFLNTGYPAVLLTDTSRGLLIVILSLLVIRDKRGIPA